MAFPGGSDGKAPAYNAEDLGSIPGSGKSPGEGNGNPLQYSCLENPMDGGAWLATVHGVAKSRTRLSDSLSLSNNKYMFYILIDLYIVYAIYCYIFHIIFLYIKYTISYVIYHI